MLGDESFQKICWLLFVIVFIATHAFTTDASAINLIQNEIAEENDENIEGAELDSRMTDEVVGFPGEIEKLSGKESVNHEAAQKKRGSSKGNLVNKAAGRRQTKMRGSRYALSPSWEGASYRLIRPKNVPTLFGPPPPPPPKPSIIGGLNVPSGSHPPLSGFKGLGRLYLEEVCPHLCGWGVEHHFGKPPSVQPTEIRASIFLSSVV
uniref:(California timema) hypothetical protein n=1 Tax=Timema californicum TaxID=61474 RepID=A0A7R9PB86_TIMCA|nr:unnamed protein product [Timema californicum]